MFSFLVYYVAPRGWIIRNDKFPVYQEALQAFGPPEEVTQGSEKTYYWPGMYAWPNGTVVIWSAVEEDKILWLQMNMPANAKILDK